MPADAVVYRIDSTDTIVSVGDGWGAFARANGAPELAEGASGSLWDAIAGAETRLIWAALLRRVRTGAGIDVPYRCDSPGVRRHMRLTATALPDGAVEFVSSVRLAEARRPVRLLDPTARRGDGMIRCCSWCRRFDVDGWVEVEDAVVRLGLLEDEVLPQVTHGLCPECAEGLRADLDTLVTASNPA